MVPAQQLPQGFRMSLDAVGAADDQNGVIQDLKGALHLRREIHVSRGVQKGESQVPAWQPGLLGEDGNAPRPLQAVGIQKGVLVIHPAQPLQPAGFIQHGL